MALAVRGDAWDRAVSVVAAVYNARLGVTRSSWTDPADIHPLRDRERRVMTRSESRGALDAVFGF